jgi:hypothetical protein
MNGDYIEQILAKIVKSAHDEYEMRNISFLNALHNNIDLLSNRAAEWFGDDVPAEYRMVLSSLRTLAYMYFQDRIDSGKLISDPHYEELDFSRTVADIIRDIKNLFHRDIFDMERPAGSFTIRTSKSVLRESVYGILLALIQFMDDRSRGAISIREHSSSIMLKMKFSGLKDTLPDTAKLSRIFFSYHDGETYRLAVGMKHAMESLRDIGAQIRMDSISRSRELAIEVSFPSTEFLKTIEEIRTGGERSAEGESGKRALLCVSDIILEMVVYETMRERGVETVRITPSEAVDIDGPGPAVLLDYGCFAEAGAHLAETIRSQGKNRRFIIIYGSEDAPEQSLGEHAVLIQKPFNVDTIFNYLD